MAELRREVGGGSELAQLNLITMKEERPRLKPLSIQDRDFLERLEHLATEAAHVRALALNVAEKIGRENQAEFYLESICGPQEGEGTLLWVACGIGNSPLLRSKQHLQMLWHSLRALIAAQFSGFSLDDQEAIREVISMLIPAKESDSFRVSLDSYWRHELKGGTPILFSRVFAVLSLYSIVLPRLGKSRSSSGPHDSATGDTAFRQAAQLLMHVAEMDFGSTDEIGRLVWSVTLWKLSLNLYQLVGQFAESLPEAEKKTLPDDRSETIALKLEALEEKLRNQLAVILQLETASPFVVADIVGVLGGRYLNPGAEVEPAYSALYTKAAEYVLKQRGSWQAPKDLKDALQDPLVERYSPLAYLLDLPNPMLMPCLEALADAAGDTLGSLKRELASYQIKLPWGENVKAKRMQVVGAIYNGLMVGAAVSERMKDLLSDVELDELGATLPEKLTDWGSLSDSLGFKHNLSKGVIEPWIERSEMRPGAILVFGPPGTGKTTIAKTLLGELIQGLRRGPGGGANENWRFLALSPADFARQGSDLVIAAAEKLFRRLQRVRRCIVLLDEMEEFLRARGPETNRESRLITTAFLPLLQETVSKREIILIVATNFVGTIDQAVTRRGRFDLILPLGPPDDPSRESIIREALEDWPEQLWPWSKKENEESEKEKEESEERDEREPKETKEIALIVHYTMGYTQPEIRDYMQELRRAQEKRPTNDTPQIPESELWRIRQERVPMALSGNPGCNWRTFRDEAARFKRPAIAEETQDEKYWEEPGLPRL